MPVIYKYTISGDRLRKFDIFTSNTVDFAEKRIFATFDEDSYGDGVWRNFKPNSSEEPHFASFIKVQSHVNNMQLCELTLKADRWDGKVYIYQVFKKRTVCKLLNWLC